MAARPITALQAIERMALRSDNGGFSCIIDARTEDEFDLDRLPDALNWPSLTNEERIRVGTLYKQVSPFEANKVGASLVAANISRHIDRHVMPLSKEWQPLIYCWRGGKRSGSLALVLGQIGFRVWLIEGGYKAYCATGAFASFPSHHRPDRLRQNTFTSSALPFRGSGARLGRSG